MLTKSVVILGTHMIEHSSRFNRSLSSLTILLDILISHTAYTHEVINNGSHSICLSVRLPAVIDYRIKGSTRLGITLMICLMVRTVHDTVVDLMHDSRKL